MSLPSLVRAISRRDEAPWACRIRFASFRLCRMWLMRRVASSRARVRVARPIRSCSRAGRAASTKAAPANGSFCAERLSPQRLVAGLAARRCPVPSKLSHRGPDLQRCFMLAGRFMGLDVPLT